MVSWHRRTRSLSENEELMTDDVYNAMLHNDLAKLPVTVLNILERTNSQRILTKMFKQEVSSRVALDKANQNVDAGNYFYALKLYSIALLFAPNNSMVLMLAYYHRSILLHKIKQYKACLRDIFTCFKIGAGDLESELYKRKASCMKELAKNEESRMDTFFTFKSTMNSHIPCTTEDVGITFDSVVPKVIAVNDISLGTLVAMETAYVGLLCLDLLFLSCYHCHRICVNLMPCTNCCVALFCSEKCRKQCMEDVHRTECCFIEYMDEPTKNPNSKLAFKAALKMKQHSSSWSEFIELSKKVGNENLNSTSYKDVYNTNNKFSLLNFKEKNEPKYGPMFNFGYVCATNIQLMLTKPDFWPENLEEKQAAVDAFARLMMKLFLHLDALKVSNCCEGMDGEVGPMYPNYAFYSFIGQLKHNCDANLLTVGLGNKIAVVAAKDIPEGSELTISYVTHAYELKETLKKPDLIARALALYRRSVSCDCNVCRGVTPDIQYPSSEQKLSFRVIGQVIDLMRRMERKVLPHEILELAIKVLKDLKDIPQSREFQNTLRLFISFLQECQQLQLRNYLPLNMKGYNLNNF